MKALLLPLLLLPALALAQPTTNCGNPNSVCKASKFSLLQGKTLCLNSATCSITIGAASGTGVLTLTDTNGVAIVGPTSTNPSLTIAADTKVQMSSHANAYIAATAAGIVYTGGAFDTGGNIRVVSGGYYGNQGSSTTNRLLGFMADGASAVATTLDSSASYTTNGSKIVSIQNAAVEKSYFTRTGSLGGGFTDISGTPGNGTIDTWTGRAAVANTASAATITSLVSKTTSIILCQLETSGTGVGSLKVVPGNGSYVVSTLNGTGVVTATSGTTVFSCVVLNGN